MSNYVSFNFKYYKHSNKNTLGHNGRTHKNTDNARAEYKHLNFSSGNVEGEYDRIYKSVCERKGKKIQKNSNTFIDGVLAFSPEQIDALKKKYGEVNFQKGMTKLINKYMDKLRDEFGFEPVGFDFHQDEGHIDNITGEFKHNYHAHVVLFNYDVKTGKAPLRNMMGKSGKACTSKMQDIAGSVFEPAGFTRGISKSITKKKHLEKDQYIAQKHKELISELKTLSKHLELVTQESNDIDDRIYKGISCEIKKAKELIDSITNAELIEEGLAELARVVESDILAKDAWNKLLGRMDEGISASLSNCVSTVGFVSKINSFKNNDIEESKIDARVAERHTKKVLANPRLKF